VRRVWECGSQTDLARRAGVAQSVISAYESGRREPSFPMLVKLVEATGHRLSVGLVPSGRERLGLPDTPFGGVCVGIVGR
jgi:uncharacterized protein